jgi:long-chain acyl-CoA synthetase
MTLNEMILHSIDAYADLPALKIRKGEAFEPITYRELGDIIRKLGTALIDLGVKKRTRVGLISDNRYEWIMCDLAVLGTGACDVPRGSDTTARELAYIMKHAEIRIAFVEDRGQLDKVYAIGEQLPRLKTLIVMSDEEEPDPRRYRGVRVLLMRELIRRGEELLRRGDDRFMRAADSTGVDDLATIIYTSGTTGLPKGVMLSHGNIMHNVVNAPKSVPITTGDRFLSILPAWHSFERTVEYVLLYVGASNAYSKPTAQVLLKDFETEKPHYITSVPRIWESLYNAIQYKISREGAVRRALFRFFVAVGKRRHRAVMASRDLLPTYAPRRALRRTAERIRGGLAALLLLPPAAAGDVLVYRKIRERTGGELKAGISGGGALSRNVDEFFAGIGLRVLEGYGLTETSPIVSVRTFERPVPYTVGPLLQDVQVRIVDGQGRRLGPGRTGIVMVRGPLVMKGYFKDEDATRAVLSPDGWLDTGDLGRLTMEGELQITGRAKDTIVLSGGENIEPLPLEQKLGESRYIAQAMIVGQDRKTLGALIVPEMEPLEEFARDSGLHFSSREQLLEMQEIRSLYRQEIKRLINEKYGFRPAEYITVFRLLPRPFEMHRELTQTLKKRRGVILEEYRELIDGLYRLG